MNLAKSNALWLFLHVRFASILAMGRERLELAERYSLERTKVIDRDPNSNTRAGTVNGIVLAGVVWRTNTSSNFRLYVRITSGSNPRTVKLYKATGGGGGDEVATGSGNSGTDIALTASNGSGISGTYPLASSVTVETDDKHWLDVRQDWLKFARNVFDGTDAEGEDSQSFDAFVDAISEIAKRDRASVDEVVRLLERIFVADTANGNERAYGSKFLKQTFPDGLLAETSTKDGSGAVERSRSGALQAFLLACQDELTGSTQTFVRRLVAAAAAVAASNNAGRAAAGGRRSASIP